MNAEKADPVLLARAANPFAKLTHLLSRIRLTASATNPSPEKLNMTAMTACAGATGTAVPAPGRRG